MAPSTPAREKLKERVDHLVNWIFRDYRPTTPRGQKVINDSLLGNQYFSRHEVAVIDSPLLQRLKRIKQTGLVYQVFPSATHSRFEHSLGVTTIAERSLRAIQDRVSIESGRTAPDFDRTKGDLAHLRMAALLHDVGHGLCSHASEQIYELLSDLREFKNEPAYAKNDPGEILSYLMITSQTFSSWFNEYVVKACGASLDLNLIGEMVLGRHPDPDRYFLAQIVSSPYDADKLDYIARDSYYCGLALTVDLARFYSMISTAKENGYHVLVLRSYVPLEQILFSKMMLTGSVYHHQKAKCLDSMLRSTIQHIAGNPSECKIKLDGAEVSFAEPVEYLYLTDDEFFNQIHPFGDEFVRRMIARFRRRDLFARCLEISRWTVTEESWKSYGRKQLLDLADNLSELDKAERMIHEALPDEIRNRCDHGEVLISIPKQPRIKTDRASVQTSPNATIETIEKFFPVEEWTQAYGHNKWHSYVYAPKEFAPAVRDAAAGVLREKFNIEVDLKRSNETCHPD
ncbi:MAG: HD domain-containing protein [Candidatus Acidiferrum sp.]